MAESSSRASSSRTTKSRSRAPSASLPTLGRIVIFRDRLADRAAVVTSTADTVNLDELPALSSPTHVHLLVFAPAGSRPAWNVPMSTFDEKSATGSHPFGSWHWPERV